MSAPTFVADTAALVRHADHRRRRPRLSGLCACLWHFLTKHPQRSKRIDVFSRVAFPFGFFVFNCIYWLVYLAFPNYDNIAENK